MSNTIAVEVAYADNETQTLLRVSLNAGATVVDAIEESGIRRLFPEDDFDTLAVGVWGQTVARNHSVRDGDRIEIYRPLQIEPREARRQLALLGETMRRPLR